MMESDNFSLLCDYFDLIASAKNKAVQNCLPEFKFRFKSAIATCNSDELYQTKTRIIGLDVLTSYF